jgi:hypothetical protein
VNTTSPVLSKVAIVETWRKLDRVIVSQSLDTDITTIGIEIIVMPNMDAVKRGILIG